MSTRPDVAFGDLEPARFVARHSRFHASARGRHDGAEILVHIPNSGRLEEVLRPGAPIGLRPRPSPRRKTSHDLAVIAVPDAEPGDGVVVPDEGLARWWGEGAPALWASVDARLPPRVVAAAAARGAIAGLEGATVAAWEPGLGIGRADLLLKVPGRQHPTLVEAKSTTLVREGVALFPVSPTVRGAAQVAALARDRRPAMVVIVCQRGDAVAAAANTVVDGRFAATLADAVAMGVEIRAGACTVGLAGVRWDRSLPVRNVTGGVDHRGRAAG